MKNIKEIEDIRINLYCCMYQNCESEYSTKFNLKRHVESVHLHLKRFECKICSGLFSSKQSLKEHLYLHSGAMPFQCSYCLKYFRQASQLYLHKRIHATQGIFNNYFAFKDQTNNEKIKPRKIEYQTNNQELLLPKISSERKIQITLPFPKNFN